MSSVLLSEDEFLIRAVVVDALGSLGLNCIEAATGQAALDVVTSPAALAAIIVDIGLPRPSRGGGRGGGPRQHALGAAQPAGLRLPQALQRRRSLPVRRLPRRQGLIGAAKSAILSGDERH